MNQEGQRVRIARKKLGLTQAALAEKIGRSSNLLAKWERGEVKMKAETIKDIARALGIPISQLMESDCEISTIEQKDNNHSFSMAYWGGIVDNTRRVISRGDMGEIAMIYPLLKSCYEMISMVCNGSKPSLLDIRQNNVGRDATVNFGTIQQTRLK